PCAERGRTTPCLWGSSRYVPHAPSPTTMAARIISVIDIFLYSYSPRSGRHCRSLGRQPQEGERHPRFPPRRRIPRATARGMRRRDGQEDEFLLHIQQPGLTPQANAMTPPAGAGIQVSSEGRIRVALADSAGGRVYRIGSVSRVASNTERSFALS